MDDPKFKSIGTWKRYKLGQAQFTDWLKKTADKVRGKDNANGESSAGGRVHLNQMEALAKVIAGGHKPEDIPYAPIAVLRDVVELRRQSHKFYARNAEDDESVKAGNKAHAHTINVLEKVLKTLENAVSSVKDTWKAKKEEDPIANMYDLLQVYQSGPQDPEPEPEPEPEQALTSRRQKTKRGKPKKVPKPKTQVVKKAEDPETEWIDRVTFVDDWDDYDDDFDYYMLVYCFFVDFNKIRDYVAELWCDYFYDKSANHNTLAVVHNAACELFYHMEAELLVELRANGWSDLGHYVDMMSTLFIEYGIEHVEYDDSEHMTEDELNEKIWREEANWVAFSAHAGLENILKSTPPGKTPCIPPSMHRPPKYGAVTWKDFKEFTQGCAFELYLEAALIKALKHNGQEGPVLPAEPDLNLDFQRVLRVRDYPSSVVFSLQLYMDMRNIMEEQVSDAYHSMLENAGVAFGKLKTQWERAPRDEWREGATVYLKEIKHYVLGDFTYENKKQRLMGNGITEDPESYRPFKIDPVWSGLMDFRTKLIVTESGFNGLYQVPGFLRVLGFYHFYKRDELVPSWPLLDAFIQLHPVEIMWNELLREDHSVSTVLKQTRPTEQPVQWMILVQPIDIVQFFLKRYGDEDLIAADRRTRSMEYVGRVREYLERKAQKEATSGDAVRKMLTQDPAKTARSRELEKPSRDPLQHIEILRVLGETTNYLVENVFKIDYLQLVVDAKVVCAAFRDALEEKGLVERGDEGWKGLRERDDVEAILKEILGDAIGKLDVSS